MTRPDSYRYDLVWVGRDFVSFLAGAFATHESRLTADRDMIAKDSAFGPILSDGSLDSLDTEIEKAKKVRAWLAHHLQENTAPGGFPISFSHGTARYLKKIGLEHLSSLRAHRAELKSKGAISDQTDAALDRKIALLSEKMESGVFSEVSPHVTADAQVAETIKVHDHVQAELVTVRQTAPVALESIEILDAELRKRCVDMLTAFSDQLQHDRLDTVVQEATRVLEVRLRTLSGAPATVVGPELATYALSVRTPGSPPRIVLSAVDAEQQGAQSMFRGVFGFIRNPFHHRLHGDLSPQRALQIVGMIDYLLSLLDGAAGQPQGAGTAQATASSSVTN